MPKWIPNLDAALRNAANRGEQKVLRSLDQTLPVDACIFPNFRWQKPGRNRAPVDLEADVVVLLPSRGLLVLEVKSGSGHRYVPEEGGWATIISRSPTEQARSSRYDLCDKLGQIRGGTRFWIEHSFAFVVFPESDVSALRDGADGFLGSQFLGAQHLQTLGKVIVEEVEKRVPRADSLDARACEEIGKRLIPSVELTAGGAFLVGENVKEIESQTSEFVGVIASTIQSPRCGIRGAAGTGKTVLGINVLRRWIQEKTRGYYVCRSHFLARFVRQRFPGLASYIFSFDELLAVDGRRSCTGERSAAMEETEILEAFEVLRRKHTSQPISIIVDEAQDLDAGVLEALAIAADNGRFWTLYDPQQVLEKRGATVLSDFEEKMRGLVGELRVDLKENLRNTRRIADYVSRFVPVGSRPYRHNPEGVAPEFVPFGNSAEQAVRIRETLEGLFKKDELALSDVVVLSCLLEDEVRDRYCSPAALGRFGHRFAYCGESKSEVMVSSVRDFKGLERNVVLLADTEMADVMNAYYIGGSRALARLVVMTPEVAGLREAERVQEEVDLLDLDI